jgi:hypothetical protein
MRRFALIATLVGTTVLGTPLSAQRWQGRDGDGRVPPGHRPPPGMCRIWIDGVPPGQQPAPTDCANAVRNRPANGRVIFGEDAGKGKGKGKKFKGASYDRRYDRYGREDRDDEDRDGRHDRDRRGSDSCLDRNHDGRCDYTQRDTRTPDRRTSDRRPADSRAPETRPPASGSGNGSWVQDVIDKERARRAGSPN